jgi:hypothetical protein
MSVAGMFRGGGSDVTRSKPHDASSRESLLAINGSQLEVWIQVRHRRATSRVSHRNQNVCEVCEEPETLPFGPVLLA